MVFEPEDSLLLQLGGKKGRQVLSFVSKKPSTRAIQMQSNLQDAPPNVKQESSASPRSLKFIIKRPVDIAKVDAGSGGVESIENASNNSSLQARDLIQMQSNLGDATPLAKKECSRSPRPYKKSRKSAPHNSGVDVQDGGDESNGSISNQLVLYNPPANDTSQVVLPVSQHSNNCTTSFQNILASYPSNRVLPSVGAFTVQCANCFKWRLIPTKEKYEEIREHILERPFTCEQAQAWRPDITCEDPADISQDGSRLWAIDKPNIAQPPRGWERQLRIRGEGGTKFADVYYSAPTGKKLRSMVEVQKYLQEHPEYIEQGVSLSQFSFQIPRPLQENYVRKRPTRMPNPLDSGLGLSRPLEPDEVNPLSWVAPTDDGGPVYYHDRRPRFASSSPPPAVPSPPEKKKGTKPRIYVKNCSISTSSSVVSPANEQP